MSVAKSVVRVQEIVAEKFGVEIMEDWMFGTSEDFQKNHGVKLEEEIKDYLSKFPEFSGTDLLKN